MITKKGLDRKISLFLLTAILSVGCVILMSLLITEAVAHNAGAPTEVTATPGDRQVTLSWTHPTGIDLKAYGIGYEIRIGSTTLQSSGSSNTVTVAGLTNGTEYTFEIRFFHVEGQDIHYGAWSESVNATPRALEPSPDPPPAGNTTSRAPEPSAADALPGVSSEEAGRLAGLVTRDKVVFNEIFNASTDTHDWIELRNITDTDLSLDGWKVVIITDAGNQPINLPTGTVLSAGGLLLLLNTDPSEPGMPLDLDADTAAPYLVDAAFILPPKNVTLLLQSPSAWEDSAGNYFFGEAHPDTAPPMTVDVAWLRVHPKVSGHRANAWAESTPQDGTPGYRSRLAEDLNRDGVINILDLVLVAAQMGESGTLDADLNGDGTVNIQDLTLVAKGLGSVAAAPAANGLTAVAVQEWLRLARQEDTLPSQASIFPDDFSYHRGIQVLEQLQRALTPQTSALLPNYPNPFNPETWIPYQLATASDVQISIYDVRGMLVRQLDLGHRPVGLYQSRSRAAYWDGTNDLGESVASGVYFYTLTAGDFAATRKMLILK